MRRTPDRFSSEGSSPPTAVWILANASGQTIDVEITTNTTTHGYAG
eukprot:COSAG04_NODE_498_length_13385_cov_46.317853_7_plen_46_part_00